MHFVGTLVSHNPGSSYMVVAEEGALALSLVDTTPGKVTALAQARRNGT